MSNATQDVIYLFSQISLNQPLTFPGFEKGRICQFFYPCSFCFVVGIPTIFSTAPTCGTKAEPN